MQRPAPAPSLLATLVLCAACAGCSGRDRPDAPPSSIIGAWPPRLKETLQVPDGSWSWRWHQVEGRERGLGGPARLTSDGPEYRWRLQGRKPAAAGALSLVPAADDTFWLPLRVRDPGELAVVPPLPVLAIDSPAYPHLVAMLRDLITPRFGGLVTHWPAYPVPVGSPTAQSGAVDLQACLREAVASWNEGQPEPLFVWRPGTDWGVRLAHFSGSDRRPPLAIQLTRRDEEGRPLLMRILAGDNYSHPISRPFAVRAMAHELGHAMLLWGHSPDRAHLLWGAAPPRRADPSADERRAVDLLRSLPAGLDLNVYGQPTEP